MGLSLTRRRIAGVAAGCVAVFGVLWWVAAPAAVRPGPAVNVWASSGAVAPAGSGNVVAPTVTVDSPAGLPTIAGCLFDPSCRLMSARPGAATVTDAVAYGEAAAAAAHLSGTSAVNVAAPGGVSGASAGLAYGIALSAAATGTATPPETVGATGVLHADGTVTEVAAAAVKATSARNAGAALMLAPAGGDGDGVQVVAVSSLKQAWEVLCARGAEGPLCR